MLQQTLHIGSDSSCYDNLVRIVILAMQQLQQLNYILTSLLQMAQ